MSLTQRNYIACFDRPSKGQRYWRVTIKQRIPANGRWAFRVVSGWLDSRTHDWLIMESVSFTAAWIWARARLKELVHDANH